MKPEAWNLTSGHATSVVAAPAAAPQSAPMMAWGNATVPLVFNYQGDLKDAEGNPLTGYYTMTFRVYLHVADPITRAAWSETHVSVTVRAGQRLGLLGKEGGSGGWSHLHFDITCRQPSGKWGSQEAYAFAWEAYRQQYAPQIVAVARPHRAHRVSAV